MAKTPHFDVPSGVAARVSIIDSSLRVAKMPLQHLMKPAMAGLEFMPPPQPVCCKTITEGNLDLDVPKNVADILRDNQLQPSDINSVIWRHIINSWASHHHFDHIGDVTTFPGSTELVVGQGFKEAFCPGYPTNPDSPIREVDYKGRTFREIDFDKKPLSIGPFRGFDFFGDGSFYLLDTPGHAIGHVAGLARTTIGPDTFIFMGGDICHHGGEIRPSPYLPIPQHLSQRLSLSDSLRLLMSRCPATILDDMNVKRGRYPGGTFFDPNIGFDKEHALKTIKETQKADAQDNVFFIFAHDMSIMGVVDEFPKTANDWKAKGWKEKTRWRFLNDFEEAVKEQAK
ncbi:Cytochrome P450 monooxygenase andK [Fusarium culmorum]|uniref:Cytochrome P450 monooxygenase andK n=1 Tax=Fusarium culmorum TaxID=5516 RepID=A0A2T4GVJ6_FUSCU|nr:Cytochrome P450 monooxygenase andK [Fusarium culmorum]